MDAYLDLSKVFDIISNDILLHKLNYVRIKGISLDCFNIYLTIKKQYVHVNNVNSSLGNVTSGIPQGAVLGPLFLLIY